MDIGNKELNDRQELAVRAIAYISGTIESREFDVAGQKVRIPRELALVIAAHAYAVCENLLLGMNREQRRNLIHMPLGVKDGA